MLPQDIGHAAAYEAYRSWKHHRRLYGSADAIMERQKEVLVALAVAQCELIHITYGVSMGP